MNSADINRQYPDRYRFEPEQHGDGECAVTTCDAKGEYEWYGEYVCLYHYEMFIEQQKRILEDD